jgi:hypothetical protein
MDVPMSIDPENLRQSILSDGVDDYFGLYEIIWSLNTKFPKVGEREKLAAAIPVAIDLLDKGLIELYETEWASGSYRPLAPGAAAAAVRNPASWKSPPERPGTYVCFAATEAGERLYYSAGRA